MKECSICHNRVREKALYCDYCGNLFENLVKINYNSDFNKLLIELSKLIKRDEEACYENNSQIENLIDLFWYYMFKYSVNLEKLLNKEELSFESISFFPREICYNLKKVNETEIFRIFVMKFNEKLNNLITSKNTSEYTFYFLTNIDKKNSKINEIAKLFHLEILSYDSIYKEIKFPNEYKYLNYSRSLLMIKCVIKGKDSNYLYKLVLEKVYSFFGLLTIMEFFNRRVIRYSNQVGTKYNLVNYKILTSETYIEIEDNEKFDKSLQNNYLFQYYLFDKNKKIGKELFINDNYVNKFKEISKNPDIYEKLTQYLSLYYKASIDETLEGSFIKYWILTEKIIKNMLGDMKSDKLMQYRKKVMKKYYKPYLVNRLDELRVKRNDYVHELKNDINQSDCNLIRLVAENLIIDIFSEFDKVKKFNDYGLLLEFKNQKQKINDITKFVEQGYL